MSTANASDDDDRTASSSVASFSRVPTIPARRRLPRHRFHFISFLFVSSHLIRSSRRATPTPTPPTPPRPLPAILLHRRRRATDARDAPTDRMTDRPTESTDDRSDGTVIPEKYLFPTTHSRRVTSRENTPGPRSRPICNPNAFGRSIRSIVVTRRTRARERRRPTESRAGRFFSFVRSVGWTVATSRAGIGGRDVATR